MKLFLDDVRDPWMVYGRFTEEAEGWTVVRTYDEAVKIMEENRGKVTALSLDYDLGWQATKSGFHFLQYCHKNGHLLPINAIRIHSQSTEGWLMMERFKRENFPKE